MHGKIYRLTAIKLIRIYSLNLELLLLSNNINDDRIKWTNFNLKLKNTIQINDNIKVPVPFKLIRVAATREKCMLSIQMAK